MTELLPIYGEHLLFMASTSPLMASHLPRMVSPSLWMGSSSQLVESTSLLMTSPSPLMGSLYVMGSAFFALTRELQLLRHAQGSRLYRGHIACAPTSSSRAQHDVGGSTSASPYDGDIQ